MNSTILNCLEINQLKELCNLNSNWKLLYRTKDNGFKISEFYAQCKEHSPTLMIIKTTKNYVFGGYTKANWTCNNDWISDKSAFIFSLINKWNKPHFMEIKNSKYATWCGSSTLSFSEDIMISDSNTQYNYSSSYLGSNYKYNHDKGAEYHPNEFLAGSEEFQVKQIEVFKEMQ